MVIVFAFLEQGSWNIVMLAVYLAGAFTLFAKANSENNYHYLHVHKLLVIQHALLL